MVDAELFPDDENMDINENEEQEEPEVPESDQIVSSVTGDEDMALDDGAATGDEVAPGDTEAEPTGDTEDMTEDLGESGDTGDTDPTGDTGGTLPPPYAATAPPPRPQPSPNPFVRDPSATLGGVASGLAHRYGWDVALTRLAFVVLILATSGFGLIVYLLAWLIIPRADHWPPPPASRRSRLSPRDLGVALAVFGGLLALAIGGGEIGAVLVPVALVGGGIYLLAQGPKPEPAVTAADPVGMVASPATTPQMATYVEAPSSHPSQVPAVGAPVPTPAGEPVPRRSRRRRFALVTLFVMAFLALLAIIAIPIALLIAVSTGGLDFSTDNRVEVRPASIEEIPPTIIEDTGEVILDLSALDRGDFDDAELPVEVLIDVDFGSIRVVVPDEVAVEVDAEADVGSVQVFGGESNGFGPSRSIGHDEPDLSLELDLNIGEILSLIHI